LDHKEIKRLQKNAKDRINALCFKTEKLIKDDASPAELNIIKENYIKIMKNTIEHNRYKVCETKKELIKQFLEKNNIIFKE
jgi:hypothetical protein